MTSVDGDIKLSVGVSTKPVESKIKTLSNLISRLFHTRGNANPMKSVESGISRTIGKVNELNQTSSHLNLDTRMQSLENRVKSTAERLSVAKARLDQFNASIPHTEKYDKLLQKIEDTKAEFQQLAAIAQYDSNGLPLGGWAERLDEVEGRLSALRVQQKAMQSDGSAYETNRVRAEELANSVEQAGRAHELAKSQLEQYRAQLQNEAAASTNASSAAATLKSRLSKLATVASRVWSALKTIGKGAKWVGSHLLSLASKAKSAFMSIIKHSKSASSSASKNFSGITKGVKRGLTTILKYGLGVRSLFFLFRKLRNAAKEGFENLGGYSSTFNKTVSDLLSAAAKLKNSFAAAFQPIATVVIPILTKFINTLATALNKLAEFFAAFTGQDYVYQAVDTTVKYVEDETKETVKKIKRYTSPLDDMNIYSSNKDTSSNNSSSADPKTMFETKTVDGAIKSLVDKIKALLNGEDWTEIGRLIGKKVNEALEKIRWSAIITTVKKMAKRIATLLNGFIEAVDWTLVGNTLSNAIRTVLEFAYTFIQTFNFGKFGKAIGDAINGAISSYNAAKFAKVLSGWITGIFDVLYSLVSTVKWEKISKSIVAFISNIKYTQLSKSLVRFLWSFAKALKSMKFAVIGEAFRSGLNKINWKGIWKGVTNLITTALQGLTDFFGLKDVRTTTLKTSLNSLFTSVKNIWTTLKNTLSKILVPIINKLLPAAVKLLGSIFDAISPIIDALTPIFETVIDVISSIVTSLSPVIQTIGKVIATVIKVISPILDPILKLIANIVELLAPALDGILQVINFLLTPLQVIAGLVGSIVGSLVGNNEPTISEKLKNELDNLDSIGDDLDTIYENIDGTIKSVDESLQGTQADLAYIDDLKSRMDELLSKSTLTPQEMKELDTIADLLSEKLPDFKETWNQMVKKDSEGNLHFTKGRAEVKQSIDGVINKLKEQYATEAAEDQYKELYKEKIKVNQEIAQAQANVNEASKKAKEYEDKAATATSERTKLEEERTKALQGLLPTSVQYNKVWAEYDTKIRAAKNTEDEAKATSEEYNKKLDAKKQKLLEVKGKQAELNVKTKQLSNSIKVLSGKFDKNKDDLQELRDAYDKGFVDEKTLKSQFKMTAKELFKGTKSATEQVTAGIKAGVKEGKRDLEKSGQTVGNDVIKGAYKTLGIHSPSTAFQTVAKYSIEGMKKGLKDNINSLLGVIDTVMGKVVSRAKSKALGLKSIFNFLPNAWKNRFTSARNSIKNILNQMIADLETYINRSISGLNALIRNLNTVAKASAGKNGKYTIYPELASISIPRLAQGAVIPPNREFLAVLGDQQRGQNIEAPEDLIRQIVREETGKVKGNTYKVQAQVKGRTLFEVVLDEAKLQQTQTGVTPLDLSPVNC